MIRALQIRLEGLKTDLQIISILHVLKDEQIIHTCYMLERPWKNNRRNESCIPLGKYMVKKRKANENGSRFGYEHFQVMDVHNRSEIKWHVANYVHELLGCAAPGILLADLNNDGLIDVVSSRKALDMLVLVLPDEFNLTIIKE